MTARSIIMHNISGTAIKLENIAQEMMLKVYFL